MENKIAITDDLSTLFFALTLEEGLWNNHPAAKRRAEFLRQELRMDGHNTADLFSLLTHFLLLYDKIEMPYFKIEHSSINSKDIKSLIEARPIMPVWLTKKPWDKPFQKEYIPDELAINVKPFVINACMNEYHDEFFSKYAIETVGSVDNLYSYIFDRYYYRKLFKENSRIESDINEMFLVLEKRFPSLDYFPDLETVWNAFDSVEKHLREFLIIRYLAKEGPRDFYTPSFSNYHNSLNVNDAYCIVKNQISMIMDEQPAFDSLTDILRFRDQKHRDIKLLRDEVSTLEALLIQGEKEQAIQKAINDVRSANQSLIKNTAAKKTARIATYLSVPVSLLELYTFGTSYSICIGAVGTAAQFITDYNDSKNNWLFVAR